MKKLAILFLFFIAISKDDHAQTPTQTQSYTVTDRFFIGYEVAFPGGDFISRTSWSGGRFEYRIMIKPNVSVGIGSSWNSFEQYTPRTVYQKEDGSGAITSDIIKQVYTVPITASAHYYFRGKEKLLPYLGVGLGAQYSDQTVYLNIYALDENNWGFVVRPEIGLIYSFNPAFGMFLSGAYNYSTNKNDAFDIDNLHHFAVTIGITFSTR